MALPFSCSNCVRWKAGVCDHVDWLDKKEKPKEGDFGMYADAAAYTNLRFEMRTAPDFWCLKHTPKAIKITIKKGVK